jgi:carboxyl-terminal processing protease
MADKEIKGQTPQEFFTLKRKIIFTIATVLTIAISFTLGFFVKVWTTPKEISSLEWVISMIGSHYYCEEDGVVKEFTAEDYAKAISEGLLDKYSKYYTPEEHSDVVKTNKGNYFGIGVAHKNTEVKPIIYRVLGNSPAEKAGLMAGDLITAGEFNGVKENLESVDDALNYIAKMEENQEFTLYFIRNGIEKSVKIKRQVYITSYVKYEDSGKIGVFRSEGTNPLTLVELERGDGLLSLDNQTAIISLSQFEGGAANQMEQALSLMVKRNRSKLILDLRSNGGGNMRVLCEIATNFIKKNNAVIYYAVDKNGKSNTYTMGRSKFQNSITSICILADGNSASATECLIGAMLYYKDCFDINKLVIEKTNGENKTFGKGIMQTTYKNVVSQEAIKLTTAYVYQPDNKTCIHGKGISTIESNAVEVSKGLQRALEII